MAALTEPRQAGAHRWWPFALLLLAAASHWMVAAARPEAGSTLASEAAGCTLAALLSLAFYIRPPQHAALPQASSMAAHLRSLLSGAMLFGGPAVTLLIRGRELDAASLTIALALTPVVIAIAASALGTEISTGIAGRLWPGCAAVAGLLLVLAQPTLGDARADLALILAPTLTGIGAALFCVDQPAERFRVPSALIGASALFTLALAETCFVTGSRPSISLLAVACDGVLALLGIITLVQLGATRWSSQFTWVPLLIVLEGIAVVRPHLTAYWILGLILLALASVHLLLPQADEPSSSAPAPTILR